MPYIPWHQASHLKLSVKVFSLLDFLSWCPAELTFCLFTQRANMSFPPVGFHSLRFRRAQYLSPVIVTFNIRCPTAQKYFLLCALRVNIIVFRLQCRSTGNTSQTTLTHACPCFDGCCKSAAVAPLATGLRNERPSGAGVGWGGGGRKGDEGAVCYHALCRVMWIKLSYTVRERKTQGERNLESLCDRIDESSGRSLQPHEKSSIFYCTCFS